MLKASQDKRDLSARRNGLTENAGQEIAKHEIAGHENAGHEFAIHEKYRIKIHYSAVCISFKF